MEERPGLGHLKPGDLIKVDPVDWQGTDDQERRRVVLTAVPAPIDKVTNPVVASLKKDEVGLCIAVTLVENSSTTRGIWQQRGQHVEALVLFGTRLGWNEAQCFSVVE